MYCPKCNEPLKDERYSKLSLAGCSRCHGTWYSGESLSGLLHLENRKNWLDLSRDLAHKEESDIVCPDCHCPMEAKRFKSTDGLTLDQCPKCHGIWFDKNELVRTKQLVREYLGKPQKESQAFEMKRGYHPLRAYPVKKTQGAMPRVLYKMPPLDLDEERDEKAEEQELERETESAELNWAIWLFTALTGFPLEAYNPPRKRFPFVVVFLLLANLFVHLWAMFSGIAMSDVYAQGGMVPQMILNGQGLFTLFTYAFLHSGWLHLIGNMYFLWTFGDNVEDRLGHFTFLLFYFGCGILAGLCQVMLMGKVNIPVVGASGAVAGIMGAYLYLFPKAALYQTIVIPYPFKVPVTLYLGVWVLWQFIGHFYSPLQVAWWAHLGGFFVGLALVWIGYSLRRPSQPTPIT